jgi:hypothetical protein
MWFDFKSKGLVQYLVDILIPDRPDKFGLTREQRRLLRKEAQTLRELNDKLSDALVYVNDLAVEENQRAIRKLVWRAKARVLETLNSKPYIEAVKEVPWLDRLQFALRGDVFLRFSVLFGLVAALFTVANIAFDFREVAGAIGVFIMLLLPKAAMAATEVQSGVGFSARDGLRYLILIAITMGFACAMAILAFSNKADARKFAADMIKTILGVYAGMATKLVD